MLPVLFGALVLALVDCAFYVTYVPNATSMAWTMLLLWLLLSWMAWTMWSFCGLDYVPANACFYDTMVLLYLSLRYIYGHNKWYLRTLFFCLLIGRSNL
jgi:hypothetical protein